VPYILKNRRKDIQEGIIPDTAGELNYAITMLLERYLLSKGTYYRTINDIVGALECAKMELYRRIAAPYEDIKCSENGDVYVSNHTGKHHE